MSDLVAFLLARIEEDQHVLDLAEKAGVFLTSSGLPYPWQAWPGVGHYPAVSPQRFRAEVAAGQREIAIYEKTARLARQLGGDYLVAAEVARQMLLCRAQTFTQHHDFDQAWLLPEVDLG